jgi:small-conductance mechanosensitive channel
MENEPMKPILFYFFMIFALVSQESKDGITPYRAIPIFLENKEIFHVYSPLGKLTPEERAVVIQKRLETLHAQKSFDPDQLKIVHSEETVDLIYDSTFLLAITDEDALATNKTSEEMAEEYREVLVQFLRVTPKYTVVDKPEDLFGFLEAKREVLFRSLFIVFSFLLFLIINYLLSKFFRKIHSRIESNQSGRIRSFSIKGNEVVSAQTFIFALVLLLKGIQLSIAIGFVYAFIAEVFILFPWTQSDAILDVLKGILLTLLTIAIGMGVLKVFQLGMTLLIENVPQWKGGFIQPFKFRTVVLFNENQIVDIFQKLLYGFQIFITLFILYIFIPISFSFFEFTSTWADTLFGYIFQPFKKMGLGIVQYLPNLFFIIAILIFTRFTNKLIQLFFGEIEKGHISFPNFQSEWAEPSFKIVRTLVNIFALILIFPYLPGSQSEAFKGVSMFVGILFSLGSTSVISNVVSGVVLTYTNAFRIGDRIKIGEIVGIVIEKNLLVTRVETTKKVIITFPNSLAMGNHVINYTTSAKTGEGLVLHTTVTLGYDVPWRKVHEVLIAAGQATTGVLSTPKPFVLQTALGDFNVSYELNCYTDQPESMSLIYSHLHQNIQDKCNEAGIEILSPNYIAARDGNQNTIPSEYLETGYEPPSFAVKFVKKMNDLGK